MQIIFLFMISCFYDIWYIWLSWQFIYLNWAFLILYFKYITYYQLYLHYIYIVHIHIQSSILVYVVLYAIIRLSHFTQEHRETILAVLVKICT